MSRCFRSLECDAMEWNGMKWNEESCTLDDKAFTHYSIIGEDRCRDDASLSSSRFSRREYIWNALFDVPTPERNSLALEKRARKCRKSESKRPGTALLPIVLKPRVLRETSPFPFQPSPSADSPLIVLPCNQINRHDGNFTRSIIGS